MFTDDEMKAALGLFLTEARELLQDVEQGLLGLEDDPSATESVNAVFRAVHNDGRRHVRRTVRGERGRGGHRRGAAGRPPAVPVRLAHDLRRAR